MHNMYMNQPGQTAPGPYQAMPSAATGEKINKVGSVDEGLFDSFRLGQVCFLCFLIVHEDFGQ